MKVNETESLPREMTLLSSVFVSAHNVFHSLCVLFEQFLEINCKVLFCLERVSKSEVCAKDA